jgi:aldehyde dehydrogenase (NAD+)
LRHVQSCKASLEHATRDSRYHFPMTTPENGRPVRNGTNGHAAVLDRASSARITGVTAQGGWDYSPAPETVKVEIAPRYGHFMNGAFVEPKSRERFATLNPATEQTLSQIAQGSEADVDAAVQAARKAQPKWAALPATERAKYIFRIARRIQERGRELAVLETLDSGKPIKESRDVDIPLVAAHFFYYAGWADKLQYAFPGSTPGPVGVCGQIIPWNFPLLMAAWKIAPALACGNTVVLKPAETTSLTALRLAEIFQEVELPPGVVNIITGAGETGAALVSHTDVDKIAFTGSTEIGKRIAKAVAGSKKKLTLELGGKSPNIIFEDASIDQAVEGIIAGIFFNQGHVCCAGSRLFVQESVVDQVIAKLQVRMASIRVGDPMDKNTDLGAINSRMQLDKIQEYLTAGQSEGATLHVSGRMGQLPGKQEAKKTDLATGFADKGFFCRPCFFSGVQPSHLIAREEIFGPVLSVLTFRTPEEAITRANNTQYGLAAGVWTDKGSKIFEIARKLEAGVVCATRTTSLMRPHRSAVSRNRVSGARAECRGCGRM